MIKIIKYIQYLLLTACIVQNSTLGPETLTTGNPVEAASFVAVPNPHPAARPPKQNPSGKAPAEQPVCKKTECRTSHASSTHKHDDTAATNTTDQSTDPDLRCTPCATEDPMKTPKCHDDHAHPGHEHHNDSPADSSPKDESANPDLKCTPCATEYMPEDHHHTRPKSPNVTKLCHRRTESTPAPTPEAPANESGNPSLCL